MFLIVGIERVENGGRARGLVPSTARAWSRNLFFSACPLLFDKIEEEDDLSVEGVEAGVVLAVAFKETGENSGLEGEEDSDREYKLTH